ncbi:hypothetical protein KI387_011630, partial [Taxus chinensis]
VTCKNIDKATTNRALFKDIKEKNKETEHLKVEKEQEDEKNEAFLNMVEEIGDDILK